MSTCSSTIICKKRMLRLVSVFGFMAMILLLLRNAAAAAGEGLIGAIVDGSSRPGKEKTVAIEMALEDFYHYSNRSFTLLIRNSQGNDPLQAALAAKVLIEEQNVEAIIGPETWEETSLVGEVCSQKGIPLLSLADATPEWAPKKWNFLLQTSPNEHMQMKAVAAIVQSWGWFQVNVVYEDTHSSSIRVLPHLPRLLREVGAEISNLLPISPFVSSSLMSQELEKLRDGYCRVFVVHLSFPLALQLFETAEKMNMMGKGYVWIATDPFTSLVHSLNASTLSSMQGVIGVKRYVPEVGNQYQNFHYRFCKKFRSEEPEVFNHEPGIFAAQAYDSTWALALAMRETNNRGGKVLLDKILLSNFTGLSGKIEFTDHKMPPVNTFQIINVVGKSYRELGFWSDGLNFSEIIGPSATFSSSMKDLGQVFWPGGPSSTPAGAKLLRIGVPSTSTFKQYVNIIQDQYENTTSFKGFAIDLFKATLDLLPYDLQCDFFAFNGSYDELVQQIYLKKYDVVVGDVAIVSTRYRHAEFTQPYTSPGVIMVVPVRSKAGNGVWLLVKPFTKLLWILIGVMIVYNGFVVWIIERNHHPELNGPLLNQLRTMLWLTFTTIFSLHGDKLQSSLSRMAIVVWVFVGLIIAQTYTASLTSMLTVARFEPAVDSVEQLRSGNAVVGYDSGSYLKRYLEEVLHFRPDNIKQIDSPEMYAEALRSEQIAAAFLDVPEANIFLAKHCKGFTRAGPTYQIGGYGFAFPRGSPLLHSVNQALLNVSENGTLRDLENSMLASEDCKDDDEGPEGEISSLGASSFMVLFIITGGTSTLAFLVYFFPLNFLSHAQITMRTLMIAVVKKWGSRKRLLSRRVSNAAESPLNSPNTSDLPAPV